MRVIPAWMARRPGPANPVHMVSRVRPAVLGQQREVVAQPPSDRPAVSGRLCPRSPSRPGRFWAGT